MSEWDRVEELTVLMVEYLQDEVKKLRQKQEDYEALEPHLKDSTRKRPIPC